MKKISSFLISFLVCLCLLAGCTAVKDEETDGTESIDTRDPSYSGSVNDTGDGTQNTGDPETELDPEASLTSLRQAMVGTSQIFAAAYIDSTDEDFDGNTVGWIEKSFPGLCGDLPFVCSIPEDRIIGEKYGELYCIVPLDPGASVAVNKLTADNSVLYRSESGEPILIFCNGSETVPDTLVTVTDNDGNTVSWSPCRTSFDQLILADANDTESIFMDFSPYVEYLAAGYEKHLSDGWRIPEADELIGTFWQGSDRLSDGTELSYEIDVLRDKVYISWNDRNGDFYNYAAYWSYNVEDGVFKLELDLGELDGIRSFCVLVSAESNRIYISQDFADGYVRDYEKISRVLERTFG